MCVCLYAVEDQEYGNIVKVGHLDTHQLHSTEIRINLREMCGMPWIGDMVEKSGYLCTRHEGI